LAEHVWEHLDKNQGRIAAEYCFQYLKPGASLRLAVPDGLHPDPTYIAYVNVGGNGPGAVDHRVLYDYRSLQSMLEGLGFRVKLLEYFDVNGKFQTVPWENKDGPIERSLANDPRNVDGQPNYTSLIVDAIKPTKGVR
jgi:predicted SAM-dependent methyltransferase